MMCTYSSPAGNKRLSGDYPAQKVLCCPPCLIYRPKPDEHQSSGGLWKSSCIITWLILPFRLFQGVYQHLRFKGQLLVPCAFHFHVCVLLCLNWYLPFMAHMAQTVPCWFLTPWTLNVDTIIVWSTNRILFFLQCFRKFPCLAAFGVFSKWV